jgi:hypothetical protein
VVIDRDRLILENKTGDNRLTFREVINLMYEHESEDSDLQAFFAVVQILRTIIQREPATLEGCCSSALSFLRVVGDINRENIERTLGSDLLDLEIDDSIIRYAISIND